MVRDYIQLEIRGFLVSLLLLNRQHQINLSNLTALKC